MIKEEKNRLNEFIEKIDGFKSVKLVSEKQAEFIMKDDSKKIIDF